MTRIAGRGGRAKPVQVLLTSTRSTDPPGIEPLRDWLAAAIEAKRVVRAHLVTAIGATVASLARAAGVDPTVAAKPLVDGAARRLTSDRVTAELLRVVDLPAAERQAVAATRARARARGAGPLGAITSRIYRWSGRQGRVADPAAFLARWRERGSLAPALEVLRGAVDVPLHEAPAAMRGTLASSVEPAALSTNLARAVDRAIAARAANVPSSRIWTVIGLLQTLATMALVFSAVWVALWVFVKFPVDVVVLPVLGQVPIPFIALVASLAGRLPDRPAPGRPCRLGRSSLGAKRGARGSRERRAGGRDLGVRGPGSGRGGAPGVVERGSGSRRGLRARTSLTSGAARHDRRGGPGGYPPVWCAALTWSIAASARSVS